jgi:hypothetical protein
MSGMVMIGDMFNDRLKARVAALCAELAALPDAASGGTSPAASGATPADWWPTSLGRPASAGGQNDVRYAFFPSHRRLLVQRGANLTCYDTGNLEIVGVAQQQQIGSDSLVFTSRQGPVPLGQLPVVPLPS